ncbi:probable peptidoglycan muropeptide transporter SLC46 isoform X2 [Apis cerana]|uniref:Solute carrier family n=2 Tax=Apis cerana TaxID=7461 RepID=A0A2A3ED49_APICC|nr:probable peptidoglycan muropeptide transporter SLC46 isoform X2 [Apis cerana]XP_061934688.1 probable peptidoglycan muropeptide transporter SLC46 isoform X2 [Apis cerana]XP_061934689.1 probable peptidoglycan muropeptide transporter SLC46 isoform X2 [Apis cerana]XP_061934690.1 probable peptidoglycan muropeptide transporter SLC46 isoform X2 [Apis cerana]XP_061934691.1 probable peptidoglycan muropeptide transporter SLC46 isoform X2 [Apis cerana]XP_061934692.1 probable peptidoglycan muropeptide 
MENELRLNENETGKKWKKFFAWIKDVSVEPTMWLFMMAFMITSVVEQAFFVYKSCRVDHGYSEKICSNLNDNETIKTAVQLTVSNFHQWNNIAGHVVPIILAFFYGNWSDRRGRKLPLIMGLLGKFIYSFMIVINSMMDTWNLNTVVYFATLPMGMLGGDVVIFGSCFAYISDISSIQQRTLRITILDVIYLSTMPTGVALGSYIYTNVVNKSYTIMFIINATLLFLAILYSLIKLKWQTLPQQQVLMGTNLLTDFFDKKHIIATIKTMIKTRPNHGKLHLLFLLIIMMLYVFQRDEKPMSFLYTQLKFKWDVNTYSNFKTFQSSTFVLAMLIGVPIMSKLMKIRDTIIVAIGAIAHASGRIIFALAKIPELFYVGAGVAALGPIVAPVLRSMTSKLVTIEERGKIFAILSVCDNAVPLFSSILYSQLYNATINSAPSSIYWLTFITQIFVLFLILIIHFSIKNRNDQYIDDEINN